MTISLNIKIFDDRLKESDGKYYPRYAKEGDVGIDLRACIEEPIRLQPGGSCLIPVGFAIDLDIDKQVDELPFQLAGMVLPRSGSGSLGLVLGTLVGLIDTSYQGQIMVQAWNRGEYGEGGALSALQDWPGKYDITINPMERFAQLVVTPVWRGELRAVDSFATVSDRGEGGFGHTGDL